jgi:hypothetical protein
MFFKEIINSYHNILLILASLFRQLWPPRHPERNPRDYLWEALKGTTIYFNTTSSAPHHTYVEI